MIDYIQGIVLEAGEDHLIILVGGVGFRVYATSSICKQTVKNTSVSLFTHLVVKEESLTLYGFERREEVQIFTQLLGCNGVGPRTALNVLSVLSYENICAGILQENADVFAHVPGIGKKTAQSIILHMQGKIDKNVELGNISKFLDVDAEVMEALTSLGYSVIEAQAAIQSIPKETPREAEIRLRLALGYFST